MHRIANIKDDENNWPINAIAVGTRTPLTSPCGRVPKCNRAPWWRMWAHD